MFAPINSDHAVARVTFRICFSRPFSRHDIEAIAGGHEAWKSDFPAMRQAKGFTFGPSSDGSAQLSQTPGVEFAYLRPDGSQAWLMAAINNELVIECSRYTRWEKIWSVASRNLRSVLNLIPTHASGGVDGQRKVISAGLAFQDIFFWKGDFAEYSLEALLRPNSMIADTCFSRGPVWHSHVGWFESIDELRTVLVTLNVTGAHNIEPAVSRGAPAQVEIANEQELRFVDGGPILSDFAADDFTQLTGAMEHMHSRNKELLEEILIDTMSKSIGLSS